MPTANPNTNNDQATRLLDLLPDAGEASFGSAMLRMAHAAAALHRGEQAGRGPEPWHGLSVIELTTQDKAGHGSPSESRSARATGPATTEGDR